MRKIIFILLTFLVIGGTVKMKADEIKKNIAIELETLAYINNGYYISGIFGYDPFRVRILTLNFDAPNAIFPKEFKSLNTTVYGVIFDYYFFDNLEGLWTDLGFEYGINKITEKNSGITKTYSGLQIGTGLGYLYDIYNGFFINPWVGVNMNVIYDKEIKVGNSILKQDLFIPLAGIKLGWRYTF